VSRSCLCLLAAAALVGLVPRPALADPPPWMQACLAIQPTVPCTSEHRVAIEEAIAECRKAKDQLACQRSYLARPPERVPPPTVLRGGRSK
jgi:hypothetical protein